MFHLNLRKNFFMETVVRYWKKLTKGNGGVSVTSGIEEVCGCGVQGYGLAVALYRPG